MSVASTDPVAGLLLGQTGVNGFRHESSLHKSGRFPLPPAAPLFPSGDSAFLAVSGGLASGTIVVLMLVGVAALLERRSFRQTVRLAHVRAPTGVVLSHIVPPG
jgi:hypothetical protein